MKIVNVSDVNCRNWGEKLVSACTQKLIQKYLKSNEIITLAQPVMPNDKIDNPYPEVSIEKLNDADLIFFGGGGTFNFLRYSYIPVLQDVTKPMIVYSSGWNRLGFTDAPSQRILNTEIPIINALIKKCIYFSVRADGTREHLLEFGFSNLIESPDPAILTKELFGDIVEPFKKPYVVVSIGADFPKGRFEINGVDFENFKAKIFEIINKLDEKYTIVITQHRNEDLFIDNKKVIYWNHFMETPIEYGISLYANADAVLASRGHALYLAASYGIPAIAISDYPKIEYIAKLYGYESIRITEQDLVNKVLNAKFNKPKDIIERKSIAISQFREMSRLI